MDSVASWAFKGSKLEPHSGWKDTSELRDDVLTHKTKKKVVLRPVREDDESGEDSRHKSHGSTSARRDEEDKKKKDFKEYEKLLKTVAEDDGMSDEEIRHFESLSLTEKTTMAKKAKVGAIKRVMAKVRKAKNADIVFMVDSTGSMCGYINMVKNYINNLVEQLIKPRGPRGQSYISKVRVAFVGYRDLGDGAPSIIDFTEDLKSFRSSMSSVVATGGGDLCEDVFGGLQEVQRLSWSENAGTRVLFHIADAPCHGRAYHDFTHSGADDFPGGDPRGRSLSSLLGWLKENKVLYVFGPVKGKESYTEKMIRVFSSEIGYTIEKCTVDELAPLAFVDSVYSSIVESAVSASSHGARTDRLRERKYTLNPEVPSWSLLPIITGRVLRYKIPRSIKDIIEHLSFEEEKVKEIRFKVGLEPFGAGGERIAYHGIDLSFKSESEVSIKDRIVLKEFKHVGTGMNKARRYEESAKIQTVAAYLARRFAKEVGSADSSSSEKSLVPMKFTKLRLVSYKEPGAGGRFKYMACEPFLRNCPKFVRLTDNMRYVIDEEKAEREKIPKKAVDYAMAFAHWTYHATNGYLLVTDLQGALVNRCSEGGEMSDDETEKGTDASCMAADSKGYELLLTDPAIHCKDCLRFGKLNQGETGMAEFFKAHACGPLCKKLGLECPDIE